MSRLSRYLLREILAPTVLGYLAYTSFMLVRALVQFSTLLLQSDSPGRQALEVLALSVPHISVLTLPIAFLLGVLIGVGRMGADSELIAIRAAGLDLVRLYRPILALAFVLFAGNAYLMLEVVPNSNRRIGEMKARLAMFAIAQRLQPGVFGPEIAGIRVYVDGASADKTQLTGLVVVDRSQPGTERITVAPRGALELEADRGRLWLTLDNAQIHESGTGGRYNRSSVAVQRVLLDEIDPGEMLKSDVGVTKRKLREMKFSEFRALQPTTPQERALVGIEFHKKFSLPAACLVFGLLGLPLAVVARRGGRSGGLALSAVVVLAYYVILVSAEARVVGGSGSPAMAMWTPNLVLAVFALWAMSRVRREKTALPSLPERSLVRKRAAVEPRIGTSRGPLFSFGLTSLVDRYVIRKFLPIFVLVVLSFLGIYLIIDLLEISDDIARNGPKIGIVLSYYQSLLAPVFVQVVPFAFLVATVVALVSLARSSEITALMAHGVSIFRLATPLVLLALMTGAGLFAVSERLVPRAAVEAERLRNVIIKAPDNSTSLGGTWLRGEQGRFLYVDSVDTVERKVTGFGLLDVDPATFRIRRRSYGATGIIRPNKGVDTADAWTRTFSERGEMLYLKHDTHFVEAPEVSQVFREGRLDPSQMSLAELGRFIAGRKRAGADVASLETGYQQKLATPWAPLLLCLIGIPFAVKGGKKAAIAGVGVALTLGILYVVSAQMLLGKAGVVGALPAVVAAWGTNALFGLAAIRGLLGVRT